MVIVVFTDVLGEGATHSVQIVETEVLKIVDSPEVTICVAFL